MASKSFGRSSPPYASWRLIETLGLLAGKGATFTSQDYLLVEKLFVDFGGSWVRVFEGSTQDLNLLKESARYVVKRKASKGV